MKKPSIDTYVRLAAAKEAAGVPGDGDSKLLGDWKVDVSLGRTVTIMSCASARRTAN